MGLRLARLVVAGVPGLGAQSGAPLASVRLVDAESFQKFTYWIAAAIGLSSVVGVYALIRSSLGLGLMTVRDNELAANTVGVDVWRNRFIAFVISAFGCGMAGAANYMGTMFFLRIRHSTSIGSSR